MLPGPAAWAFPSVAAPLVARRRWLYWKSFPMASCWRVPGRWAISFSGGRACGSGSIRLSPTCACGRHAGNGVYRCQRSGLRARAEKLAQHCLHNGVSVLNAGTYDNVIRLLMPLTISDDDYNQALQVMEDGMNVVAAELGELAGAAH